MRNLIAMHISSFPIMSCIYFCMLNHFLSPFPLFYVGYVGDISHAIHPKDYRISEF